MATASTAVHHGLPQIQLRDWVQIPLACVGAAILTYLVIAGARPMFQPAPLDLTVRQNGAQLIITWNRAVTSRGAMLDVIDGGSHTAIYIPAGLATVTYRAWTADVEVRLLAPRGRSPMEIARCLVREPESIKILEGEIAATKATATALGKDIRRVAARVQKLQHLADRLLQVAPPPRKITLPVRTVTLWR